MTGEFDPFVSDKFVGQPRLSEKRNKNTNDSGSSTITFVIITDTGDSVLNEESEAKHQWPNGQYHPAVPTCGLGRFFHWVEAYHSPHPCDHHKLRRNIVNTGGHQGPTDQTSADH